MARWSLDFIFFFEVAGISFRLLTQFQFAVIVSASFSLENASNFRRASKIWFN